MTTAPAASLRLFLGIWPAPGELQALRVHADAWSWPPSARRTPPERLHITLHFLGVTETAQLPALRQALDEVRWEGCDLLLDGAQVWPGGIAVLEAGTVPAPLGRLHAQLGERLHALGFALETRRYRPHVTFARKAFGARPPAAFEPLRWRAAPAYVLVQSLPNGGGYQPLQRFG